MTGWRNTFGRTFLRHRLVVRWVPRWYDQMAFAEPIASRARMRAGIRRVCKVRGI